MGMSISIHTPYIIDCFLLLLDLYIIDYVLPLFDIVLHSL